MGNIGPEAMLLRTALIITFIGIFLFVMLFEGRARYLLNNTSVFIIMAIFGYCEAVRALCNACPGLRVKKT